MELHAGAQTSQTLDAITRIGIILDGLFESNLLDLFRILRNKALE